MAKKIKIPKKIAGIRVPKPVRKNPILTTLLGSETGRKILGQALLAGATAAAAVLTAQSETVGEAGDTAAKRVKKSGNVASRAIKDATGAMAGVIADAARSVLPDAAPAPKPRRRTARAAGVTH